MNLLLDTHTVLWWLADAEMTSEARMLIEDGNNFVAVSAASVWEVEIKRGLGKLRAPKGFAAAAIAQGFDALPITHDHAEAAGLLPPHHRDPFDRMLVAQARLEGLTVVTRDPSFDAYDVRVVRC